MDAALLEAIAEKVHEGWMVEKRRQGFAGHVATECSFTDQRRRHCGTECHTCDLPRNKHHPDMLPYADLAENVKEYDRATVRAVLSALDGLGYTVVAPSTTADMQTRRRD